jgi:hypothetical protein
MDLGIRQPPSGASSTAKNKYFLFRNALLAFFFACAIKKTESKLPYFVI